MTLEHVEAYFTSMSKKNIEDASKHLAEHVVLLSPVFPEPFVGKAAVVPVLAGLIQAIDSLEPEFAMDSGIDAHVIFNLASGDIKVKGVEHLRVDADGLIELIEVAWRPLPSVVLMQQQLAKKLGGQPLRLVPAE